MTEERAKRKLSAILSADVKGYSRLMQDDESSTIQTLKAYRELMTSLIQGYRGRVVDSPGDNVLAEFGSVVDAVECAVKIQQELEEKNAGLSENRRMEFRIGVNLGDVVEDEDRIYGDGVNIAARVEGIAEGGGICISGSAYEQVRNKLTVGYEYLGKHTVKNIAQPVKVYRILLEPEYAGQLIGEEKPKPKSWVWALTAAAAVALITGGVTIWQFYFRLPSVEAASVENMAFPLPDKPSIAVLPFDNMSGDPEQDFIADGFTENIITGLSHIPEMFVIARNSVFTYKGKPVKIKQVSEELGVKYVLEGSVQRTGDRLRVTAQLIDALKGGYLWAERYDRELKDLFKLQDEITIKIVSALEVKLLRGWHSEWGETENFEAWRNSVKGVIHFDRITKMDSRKAKELFEQALKLDPDYVYVWYSLANTHLGDVLMGFSESPGDSIKRAIEISQKTSERWPASYSHSFMNAIYFMRGEFEKAVAEGEKAIALAPNSPRDHILLAAALGAGARPEEAIVYAKNAMRLEPYYPAWFVHMILAPNYDQAGRYEESLAITEEMFERALKGEWSLQRAHRMLATRYARLNRVDEAQAHAAELLKIDPKFSVERWRRSPFASMVKDQKWMDSIAEMLRKAGLPD